MKRISGLDDSHDNIGDCFARAPDDWSAADVGSQPLLGGRSQRRIGAAAHHPRRAGIDEQNLKGRLRRHPGTSSWKARGGATTPEFEPLTNGRTREATA